MPVPPGAPSMVKQIDLGLGTPFDRHCQLAKTICAGLQRDSLESEFSQPVYFSVKTFFFDKAETAVTLKFLDRAVFERGLNNRIRRIRGNYIAAFL